MAESDLVRAQKEAAKEAADNSRESLSAIKNLLEQDRKDNKLQAKDRVKLIKQQELITKNRRTLSTDLGKNISDLKDGITSTVDGMISSTFGPLSGVVSSFTTGFFKRSDENSEQVDAQNAAAETGKEMVERLGGVKETVEKSGEDTVFHLKQAVEELKEINGKQPEIDPDDPTGKKKFKGFGGMSITSGTSGTGSGSGSGSDGKGGFFSGIADSLLTGLGIGGGVGGIAGIKALGGKFVKFAKGISFGVVGKIFSKANPIFAAVSMGKDVFDIAKAITDGDIRTDIKERDIGGLLLGVIGAGIGFALGGPFGLALGASLGNLAGEFLGKAFETPEMIAAIKKFEEKVASEQKTLVKELEDINLILSDPKTTEARRKLLTEQKKGILARQKELKRQLDELSSPEIEAQRAKLILTQEEADANRNKLFELEDELAAARSRGDAAAATRIQARIDLLNADHKKILVRSKVEQKEMQQLLLDADASFVKHFASQMDRLASRGGSIGAFFDFLGGKVIGGERGDTIKKDRLRKTLQDNKEEIEKIKKEKFIAGLEEEREERIKELQQENIRLNKDINIDFDPKKPKEEDKDFGMTSGQQLTFLASMVLAGEDNTSALMVVIGAAIKAVLGETPTKHTGGPINKSGLYNLEEKEMVFTEEQTKVLASYIPQSGQVMNRLQMERMGGGEMHGASVVTGNDMSSNQVSNNNTTVINNPSPIGQTLFDEGRDFVSKVG